LKAALPSRIGHQPHRVPDQKGTFPNPHFTQIWGKWGQNVTFFTYYLAAIYVFSAPGTFPAPMIK